MKEDFVCECLNYINGPIKDSIPELLKVIAEKNLKLESLLNKAEIYECDLRWSVSLQLACEIGPMALTPVEVIKVLNFRGMFPVFINGSLAFTVEAEAVGYKTATIKNTWEILNDFKRIFCLKCGMLKTDCTCLYEEDEKYYKRLNTLFKQSHTDLYNINIAHMPEQLTIEQPKTHIQQTLSKNEIDSVVNGLKKQLGTNKQQIMTIVNSILKENPATKFDDLIDQSLRRI